MLRLRLNSLPLILALGICLLAGPFSSAGYVWCLGIDGHIHAKNTGGSAKEHCDPHQDAPAGRQDHGPSLSPGPSNPGQCMHIAVAAQWGTGSSRDSQVLDETTLAIQPSTSVAADLLPASSLTNGLIVAFTPRTPEPILLHRTIVLLI